MAADQLSFEERLQQAICDGYDLGTLKQMVRFRLEEKLDLIAPTSARLGDVVFDLIEWAQRTNRLRDLVRHAAESNPLHDDLAALRQEFEARPQPAPPASPVVGAAPSPERTLGQGPETARLPAAPVGGANLTDERRRSTRLDLLRRLGRTFDTEAGVCNVWMSLWAVVFAIFVFPEVWNEAFRRVLAPLRDWLSDQSFMAFGVVVRLLAIVALVVTLRWVLRTLVRRSRSRTLTALIQAFPDDVVRWGGPENLLHRPTLARIIVAAGRPPSAGPELPVLSSGNPTDPARLRVVRDQRKLVTLLEAHRSLLAERRLPPLVSYGGPLVGAGLLGFFFGSCLLMPGIILIDTAGVRPDRIPAPLVFLPHGLCAAAAAVLLVRRVRAKRRAAFAEPMPTYRALADSFPGKTAAWEEGLLDLEDVDKLLKAEKAVLTDLSAAS